MLISPSVCRFLTLEALGLVINYPLVAIHLNDGAVTNLDYLGGTICATSVNNPSPQIGQNLLLNWNGSYYIIVGTPQGTWTFFYTDEDLNPHNHRRWLHVLIHLSATFPLNDINSTPKACGFKSSKV